MADRFPDPVEANRFLKRKPDVESGRWDDLKWGEHAHAFTVAHSVKAGVAEEIHGLLNKALSEGRSFQDFRDTRHDGEDRPVWAGG